MTMAWNAGHRIGPYEIVAAIGAGGMGEVYRATDTNLGRDVAIKVLPEAFAQDPERVARFEREAKTLAALNHPNIAIIHGLEKSQGTYALVMELVDGADLSQRIARGAIPVDEALPIARQIAEALEAAHEQGIVHRDLKPANIKITPDGRVKVLDFGLAKLAERSPVAGTNPSPLSLSPTITSPALMTGVGVLLGTAAYMSPEQAKGKPADKRSDIWAFGCVLYEMLTGRLPFDGEDTTEILAAVVKTEPDWNTLPADIPASIRTLIPRCLRKELHRRLADAGAVRLEIEDILLGAVPAVHSVQAAQVRRSWRLAVGLAGVFVMAAIAAVVIWSLRPSVGPSQVTRFTIALPAGEQLAGLDQPAIALSPDGSRLAYVAARDGAPFVRQAYLRRMDALESNPVAGTEGATNIFFSPDGQWLGFHAAGAFKKVRISGGVATTISGAGVPRGATWSDQGTIVLADGNAAYLRQVSAEGGVLKSVTNLRRGDTSHRWPEFLPGGSAFLFTGGLNAEPTIVVQNMASGETRTLIGNGTSPRYMPPGHLLYAQGANLMVAPFDEGRMEVTGEGVAVVEGVLSPLTGSAQYSVSRNGSLIYVPGNMQAVGRRLMWVGRNGTEEALPVPLRAYESPRVSPDGRRLAVAADGQIWLYDFSRQTLARFTFEGTINSRPVWTPDGQRIAFYSNKDGPLNVYWQMADGSGSLERLTTANHTQVPHSWSPNGQFLALQDVDPAGGDTWILNIHDRKAQPWLKTPFAKTNPRFSPDGRWVAYESDQSGRNEIYVRPYPGPGGQFQASTDGGSEPVWSRTGRELFYRNEDKMMAVPIVTDPGFSVGKPKLLFEAPYASVAVRVPNYDVSPDGQRFLMIKVSEPTKPPTQINVIANWFEELKRLVPTQ
jgi:eukaryotic-like serine/threonine-protein kinase